MDSTKTTAPRLVLLIALACSPPAASGQIVLDGPANHLVSSLDLVDTHTVLVDPDPFPDLIVVLENSAQILSGDGSGEFGPPAQLTWSGRAWDSAVDDLDQDGQRELLVLTSQPNALQSWQLTGGNWQAGPVHDLNVAEPRSLALADLDGDGLLDAAVAHCSSSSISLHLGSAGGTFSPHASLPSFSCPVAIVASDIDLDGHLDLITAERDANAIAVHRGLGGGLFDPASFHTAVGAPAQIWVTDGNQDGAPDLVVAGNNQVVFLPAAGPGNFLVPQVISTSLPNALQKAELHDLDGAAGPELLLFVSNRVQQWVSVPGGQWVSGPPWHLNSKAVDVADLDGDGLQDLINLAGGTIVVYPGLPGGGYRYLDPLPDPPVGTSWSQASASINDDGLPDLLLVNQGATEVEIRLLLSQGLDEYSDPIVLASLAGGEVPLAAVDLDGDGRDEVLHGDDEQSSFHVLSLDSAGQLLQSVEHPLMGHAKQFLAAFVTEDDRVDILVPTKSQWLTGYRTEPDGSLVLIDHVLIGNPHQVIVGDFFGAGLPDLAVSTSGEVELYRLNPYLRWYPQDPTLVIAPAGAGYPALASGDLDTDGVPELLVASNGLLERIQVDSTVAYTVESTSPGLPYPRGVQLADLDGDQHLDLLLVRPGDLLVARNDGQGNFIEPRHLARGRSSWDNHVPLAVTDLDRDGQLDVLTTSELRGGLRRLLNRSGPASDCDTDGLPDNQQIDAGLLPDCDHDWIPDDCELSVGETDCNANGVLDSCEIAAGAALDDNGNGLPDGCERSFIRGDANQSLTVNVADVTMILSVLFAGTPAPCWEALDANGDRGVDLPDVVFLLHYVLGLTPPLPPPAQSCGLVPDGPPADCTMGACP